MIDVVAESIPLYSVCSESLNSLSGFGGDTSMHSFFGLNWVGLKLDAPDVPSRPSSDH